MGSWVSFCLARRVVGTRLRLGFGFNLNLGGTVLFHIQLSSGRAGEIDDSIPHIRSPVIDPDLDLFAILQVGHCSLGPHR